MGTKSCRKLQFCFNNFPLRRLRALHLIEKVLEIVIQYSFMLKKFTRERRYIFYWLPFTLDLNVISLYVFSLIQS